MSQRTQLFLKIGLLIVWLVLLVWGMQHHVFWRDEVRALNIAKAADGYSHLNTLLENEGHPYLWYGLLKLGHDILNSNFILPLLALLFASINAFLILFKSPFHWSLGALFLFGQYGLFEYGISARNYGIAATFMFAFALLSKKSNPLLAYISLALAAQCNFYSLIFSLLLGGVYLLRSKNLSSSTYFGLVILAISAIYSYFTCMPSTNSLVITPFSFSNIPFNKIWDIGWGFDHIFNGIWSFKHGFKTFLLLLIIGTFIKDKWYLITALIGTVFMATFHLSVRPNFSHHEGMWLCFILVLLWLMLNQSESSIKRKNHLLAIKYLGIITITITLSFNLVHGLNNYAIYLRVDQSNTDHLAEWLVNNTTNQSVLIAEPDYDMEAAMYYQDRPFYIPRESKLGTYAQFTSANKSQLSLNQIMRISDSFTNEGFNPLIISQWDLKNSIDTFNYSYGKIFEIDYKSHQRFNRNFEQLADFHEFISTDESFFIYGPKQIK